MDAPRPGLPERLQPLGYFLLLLAGTELLFGGFFPNENGLVGHDFALAHPALWDGALWFWSNSVWDVPWFTPSFCGGQPFFADPQSVYYSPLQWLAFFLPPTEASHASLLLSCSLGYWAFYFLFRGVFGLSTRAAVLGGALAMLNGFLPCRFIIGEAGYQLFLLVGFVAHALLSKTTWRPAARFGVGNVFWAGLAIAMMLQGGLTTLMLPAGLGVLALALVARLSGRGAPMTTFFARGALAVAFALALSAAKIAAGAAFMSHFPRDEYALPGFPSPLVALLFSVGALILDSQTMWSLAIGRLRNTQWMIYPHEWAYQLGLVYLLVVLIAIAAVVRRRGLAGLRPALTLRKAPLWISLVLVLLAPAALLWFDPTWNAFLKSVPLLKSTSWPFRWIIVLIPPACLLGAWAWEKIDGADPGSRVYAAGLMILLAGMLVEAGLRDYTYYSTPAVQTYDPTKVDEAWRETKGGRLHFIKELTSDRGPGRRGDRNDSMVVGQSFIRCYNPAYGYRGETLPVGRMHPGSIYDERDGYLNIKNPACLIWPEENSCAKLGDEYRVSERATARAFAGYSPIDFEVSTVQRVANGISLAALALTALALLLFLGEPIVAAVRTRRRRAG